MSSWHGENLKYALGLSTIMSFYGVVSVATFYLGGVLGYDLAWRVVIIAAVLITLPFALVGSYFANKKLSKSSQGEQEGQQAQGQQDGQPPAQTNGTGAVRVSDDIPQNAQEAVQWLKSTKLAGGADAVYALPWYLSAGPSRSGKTSLVLSSALDFQTLPSQRQTEQQMIRPTKSAEWRVTSSAVFVDTAGRYQNEGAEGEEWAGLIEAIKKVRGSRALDGLIVPVSAERLLRLNETEIEQQAKTLRARIDDLMQRTKLKFPVYLIFTHADAIEGFRDFFSISQREGDKYVWGATIPLEKAANAHALFDVEYDLLYSALMKRRLFRLANPFPPVRLLRIFNFPQRFSDARRKLGLFSSVLFRPNPFSESPLFRGFYFTANMQQTAHPRTAGVASSADDAPKAVGQGWFASKFFRDVLLRDKDMVTAFQGQKTRPPIFSGLALMFLLFISFLWVVLAGVSYIANRRLLDDTVRVGVDVNEIVKRDRNRETQATSNTQTPTEKANQLRNELDAVENLRVQLEKLDGFDRVRRPLYMRFGLYTGGSATDPDSINGISHNRYFEAIHPRFCQPVFKSLSDDLNAFNSGKPNPIPATAVSDPKKEASQEDILSYHYDLLKAYLMLTGDYGDKVEPTFLTDTLKPYWAKQVLPDSEALAERQLKFFAGNVSREVGGISRLPEDKDLVAKARIGLQAFPVYKRYYKRIQSEVSAKVQPKTLDGMLQGNNTGVLISNYTVPGAFTVEGYRSYMKAAIDNPGDELTKDDWVMGGAIADAKTNTDDLVKLRDQYERDYTTKWQEIVKSVQVRKFESKEQAVEDLTSLGSQNSPMELFMKELARQTKLSAPPENPGWWDWIKSFWSSPQTGTGSKITKPEEEFQPLFGFVGAQDDKQASGPISQYTSCHKTVKDNLAPLNKDRLETVGKKVSDGEPDSIGLQKCEQANTNLLTGFKTNATIDVVSLLIQPLDNLRAMIVGGSFTDIQTAWNNNVFPASQKMERSGFPFDPQSNTDPQLAEMSDFLSPANGKFSVFFDSKLKSSFDDLQAEGKWQLKKNAPFKFSEEFVNYLNGTRRLRDALYPAGAQQPQIEYNIKLKPVPNTNITVVIDGNTISTNGTSEASVNFKWPAGQGQAQGVKITVFGPDGGTPQDKLFAGPWGLFRMLRQGGATKGQGNEYNLQLKVGTTPVSISVQPTKGDPFSPELFTSFHAPQNIK